MKHAATLVALASFIIYLVRLVAAAQHAECQLELRGDSSGGLAVASLHCTSDKPVAVAYNSTIPGSFSGVVVEAAPPSCTPPAGLQDMPMAPLLYFCGAYQITLRKPVVQDVVLASNITTILAFGGSVTALIIGGRFTGNSGGPALMLFDHAAVTVQDSLFSNGTAYAGAAALAAEYASLSIVNTTLNANRALAPLPADQSALSWRCVGGAVLAMGWAHVSVQNATFSNNTAAFGAAIGSMYTSSISVTSSTFEANQAGVAGGAMCREGRSSQVVDSTRFQSNSAGGAGVGAPVSAAHGGGGAVFLRDDASCSITASAFSANNAKSWGGALYIQNHTKMVLFRNNISNSTVEACGGALNVYDNASVSIDQCTLAYNAAGSGCGGAGLYVGKNATAVVTNSDFHINNGQQFGGGIHLADHAQVTVVNTTMKYNKATHGAGFCCENNGSSTIRGSSFVGNAAGNAGGGVYVGTNATVNVSSCSFGNNTAAFGAGLSASQNGSATVTATAFISNVANPSGGGLYADGLSQLHVRQGCTVHSNSASTGGGISAFENSSVKVQGSSIAGNHASTLGGAVYSADSATVVVLGSNITSNTADSAGAVYADGSSNTSLVSCCEANNSATSFAGAIYITTQGHVLLDRSDMDGNRGRSGGSVYQDTNSSLTVRHSQLKNNSALIGGALYTTDYAQAVIQNSSLSGNTANTSGGAGAATHASVIGFNGCTLNNNNASEWGGALYLQHTSSATFNNTTCSNNTAPSGGCTYTDDNSTLALGASTNVRNNTAFRGGGIYLSGTSVLSAPAGVAITQNVAKSRAGVVAAGADFGGVGGGVYTVSSYFKASELSAAVLKNNAPFSANVGVSVQHMQMISEITIEDFPSRLGSDEGLLHMLVNVSGPQGLPCHGAQLQAVLDGNQFLGINRSDSNGVVYMIMKVQKPPGVYFIALSSPEAVALPPANVTLHVRECRLGEIAISVDACSECHLGSSSLDPTQQNCGECPAGANCSGSLIIPDTGMWTSAAGSVQVHRCPNPAGCQGHRAAVTRCAADPKCRPTSMFSNLQCSPQYHGNLCGQCSAGYGLTKPFTCHKCLGSAAIIGLYALAGVLMLSCTRLFCYITRAANQASCAAILTEAPLQPADLLRPLLLYFQWQLIVASSAGIDWRAPLSWAVTALGLAWSVVSPETLSIQCLLPDETHFGAPKAFVAVLFYLCMPLAMLVLCLLIDVLWAAQQRSKQQQVAATSMTDTVLSNALVAVSFYMFTSVRTVLGLFSCVPGDAPTTPPYEAAAVGSFWASDPSFVCFVGTHRAWALSLGLPCVAVICVALPAFIMNKTVANRARLHDPEFLQHWGSIYLSYKPEYSFFEGIIVLSTIVLVAISVFGLNLGRYYQSLVLNVALALILVMLLTFRPYVQAAANKVSAQATCLLMLTSYIGMSLLPSPDGLTPGPVYATAIGVLVLVLNLAFVGSVFWRLVCLVDWQNLHATVCAQLNAHCNGHGHGGGFFGKLGQKAEVLPTKQSAGAPSMQFAGRGKQPPPESVPATEKKAAADGDSRGPAFLGSSPLGSGDSPELAAAASSVTTSLSFLSVDAPKKWATGGNA